MFTDDATIVGRAVDESGGGRVGADGAMGKRGVMAESGAWYECAACGIFRKGTPTCSSCLMPMVRASPERLAEFTIDLLTDPRGREVLRRRLDLEERLDDAPDGDHKLRLLPEDEN